MQEKKINKMEKLKQCKECLIELTADNWEICQHCGSSFCTDCIRRMIDEGHDCGIGGGWKTHLNIKFVPRGAQLRIIQSEQFPKVFRFREKCDGNTDVGVPESWARLVLNKKWKPDDFKEPVEIRLPSKQFLETSNELEKFDQWEKTQEKYDSKQAEALGETGKEEELIKNGKEE